MQENLKLEQPQVELKDKIIPFISLLIGICGIATTALFIKAAVQEMSVNLTMFNRLWIASVIFVSLNSYKQIRAKNATSADRDSTPTQSYLKIDIALLLIVSLVYLAGRYLWIFCLNQTTVANAMILNSTTPLFTALGGWLFLGQTFSLKFIIGLLMAIAGGITLGLADLQKVDISLIGDGASLLSAVFFAASLLLVEKIRDKFSSSQILLWRCLTGTILVLPIVLLYEDHFFPTSQIGWIAVICMAAIGELIGHGLVVYSVKFFPSSFVAILMLLEPIIAIILAWIIFTERLDGLTWLALGLVLLGVYLAKDQVDQARDEVPELSSTPE